MNAQSDLPAVRVDGVTKHFGTGNAAIYALREIHFQAPRGKMTMIVGPSGCGKTTLLSVIAGTLSIDKGFVEVFGTALYSLPPNEVTSFRGKNIGFIFQQFNLIPTLTIQENVVIPLLIQGKPKKESYKRAAEVLDQVGMGARIQALPSHLSVGQQQRVAIARALVHDPHLVICDEPTSSLDRETGHKVMELLRNIAITPERCVIVVTHDNRIFEFADQIAQMEDGQVKNVQENYRA